MNARTIIDEMLTSETIQAIGADHADPAVALTRICGYVRQLEEDCARLSALRGKLADLGEVYVYPSDWRCAKMGGPPDIDAYEKIDLSDL